MSKYSTEEYADIIGKFDLGVIATLNPADFKDFGVMDSKMYAAKLLKLMEDAELSKVEFSMVIVLATAVKNKKRILNAMRSFKNKGLAWYPKVEKFFRNDTVQYTSEETEETFSVVHIPSCVPFLATRVWLQITQEPTVEGFLQHLWAAQINLAQPLMDRQMRWERDFWTNTVTKGGAKWEGAKFNEDYWRTKASDKYVLLHPDGTPFGNDNQKAALEPYTEADIQNWINTKVAYMAPPPPNAGDFPGGDDFRGQDGAKAGTQRQDRRNK